jgi:hypothetical protein
MMILLEITDARYEMRDAKDERKGRNENCDSDEILVSGGGCYLAGV